MLKVCAFKFPKQKTFEKHVLVLIKNAYIFGQAECTFDFIRPKSEKYHTWLILNYHKLLEAY